jgi:hypothetical protein
MNEFKKKQEHEDLLAVHKPAPQEKDKAGRSGAGKNKEDALRTFELEQLKKRLLASGDTREQEAILGAIQGRFGNEAADKAVHELKIAKKDEGNASGQGKKHHPG